MPGPGARPPLFLRAFLAFLALPGVVAFLVPAWFVYQGWDRRGMHVAAVLPLVTGFALLLSCVRAFYRAGRGTLAPWDPPQHLVVSGPYAWSRNPIYIAVLLMLVGWAMAFSLVALWVYVVALAIAFHFRVIIAEEPFLARTHGVAWTNYKTGVRRWL